jgi:ribulose-phosphate 3-epimerase
MHPEMYLDLFASLHVARVVIHAESTAAHEQCVAHGNLHGYKVGLGVLVTTPPALVDSLVPLFSYVQVMGIRHVGAQGQPFDPEALSIITRLRHAYPLLEIAVDGAVNEHTIPKLLQAGANRFAPGSAIAKSDDPVASYKQLCELLPH